MNRQRTFVLALALAFLAGSAGPASAAPAAPAPSGLDQVLDHYEAVRKALLVDSTAGVAGHAAAIRKLAAAAPADLQKEIAAAAGKLAAAKGLEPAREAFYELSRPLVRWREAAGSKRTVVAYCSMTKKSWLQPAGEIGNPYYGKEMPRCGEVVSK